MPLLRLLLLLLLLLLPFGLIACVGSQLLGLSRVMLLFLLSLRRLSGLPLLFTSFYLTDVQFSSAAGFSLGSVVAAGNVV